MLHFRGMGVRKVSSSKGNLYDEKILSGKTICYILHVWNYSSVAWWFSGRALDLRFTGRGFNPAGPLLRNIGQLSLASLLGR